MNDILQYKSAMLNRKQIWTIAAVAASFVIYFALGAENQAASPLALLVMATLGFLISLKWHLAGSVVIFFSGASLLIHPLMFSSSLLYILVAVPFCIAGILGFTSWWKSNNN